MYGSEVSSGFKARNQGCTQGHKAAQTAGKVTTGAERFNVKGRCPDVSLFPSLSLILRNPAGLLLISGKTLLTGSALPLCPLNQKHHVEFITENPAWFSVMSLSLNENKTLSAYCMWVI